jgi:hypothetical protein
MAAPVDIESHSPHPFLTKRRQPTLDARQYADWLQKELSKPQDSE